MDNLHLFSCGEEEEAMKNAARNVKTYLINTDPSCSSMSVDDIFYVSVTVHGTWQKRDGVFFIAWCSIPITCGHW